MLELRPTCENCNAPLPPAAPDARICSFECTFCSTCADGVLRGICPNCGGNLVPRPIRPSKDWKGGNSLEAYPASTKVKHRPVDEASHRAFVQGVIGVPPHQR